MAITTPLALLGALLMPQERAPLNILFLFADDHAYQAIGAYGSRINATPNIDRIARSGMRFDRCYVTNSLCAPSRAVILTGKYSHLNGIRTNAESFDPYQTTFPKELQRAGYQTALFGKWHLKSDPANFDAWAVLPGQGHYYNPDFLTPHGKERVEGYVTDIITERALHWLQDERDPKKPFLLMVQHKAPHREWLPGPNHLTLYRDKTIPEPPTLFDDYANRASPAREQKMTIADHMRLGPDLKVWRPEGDEEARKQAYGRMTTEQLAALDAAYRAENEAFLQAKPTGKDLARWQYQRYIKDYLRCIASVDDSVGRLLDYLDEAGLADRTVVVYASDQGFYLGEHGWYDKRWMYEESLRTPFLVRWPGVTAPGSTNRDIVSNLDFAPTFLAAAGIEAPPPMQGRSLLPLLGGKTPADWRRTFYYHYYEAGGHGVPALYGVTDGRYKLIHYYAYPKQAIDEWELFDLEKDPREMRSVFADPDYAEVLARMREELASQRRELQVPPEPKRGQ